MVSAAARRARWASIRDRWRPVTVAALIALGGLGPTAPRPVMACERGVAVGGSTLVQLTEVNVQRQDEGLTVVLRTGRTPRYAAMVLDGPPRIVIDLEAARYAWCGPLTTNHDPIRQVRGSQWKPGTARVVVELSRPVGYSIEERPDGLVLRVAIDPLEQARNRYEPYDAYLEYTPDSWSFLVGQLIESWSAVEMFSPADLLNRRDLERNFYDPEKLGEVMARIRFASPDGGWFRQPTFSLYVLPVFPRTPLPTNHDRFRFDITGDNVGDLTKTRVEPAFGVVFGARM